MNQNYKRHRDNTVENMGEFINPYNFISLGNKCSKKPIAERGSLSGAIICSLETLSPLFIPNTSTSQAFPFTNTIRRRNGKEHTTTGEAYDFFSYERLEGDRTDKYARPIVPGSSIRGAVRSAFEAATNSCLSTCDDENTILHRRTSAHKSKYGIIVKEADGYKLYEAEKRMLNTSNYHISTSDKGKRVIREDHSIRIDSKTKKTGDTVYVKPQTVRFVTSKGYPTKLFCVEDISAKSKDGYEKGILFLGEQFQRKHHDAVFIKKAAWHPISNNDYDRFFNVWQQYQKDSPGSYPNYITLNEIPVYYSMVGDKYYITPACISKEVFDNKISDLLGTYKPCDTINNICPACTLFGLISDEPDGSLASRIMFHDAEPVDFSQSNAKDFYEEPRQLPILGSPKISSTEFYLDDYSKTYRVWNYDYGIKRIPAKNRNERPQDVPELFKPKIRGRKFYWHKKSLTKHNENDRADMTEKIRAVKAGKKFKFKIIFDRLTERELNTLLWVLTFGDDISHAHKLGHGKPIGYGSVQYTIKKVIEYKIQDDLSISEHEYKPNYNNKQTARDISEYLILTDYENAPNDKKINYPVGTDKNKDQGVYQWFSMNKGSMTSPQFKQVLDSPKGIVFEQKPKQTTERIDPRLAIVKEYKH